MVSVFPTTSSRKTGLYFSTLQMALVSAHAKESVSRTMEAHSLGQQTLPDVLEHHSELMKGLRSPLRDVCMCDDVVDLWWNAFL